MARQLDVSRGHHREPIWGRRGDQELGGVDADIWRVRRADLVDGYGNALAQHPGRPDDRDYGHWSGLGTERQRGADRRVTGPLGGARGWDRRLADALYRNASAARRTAGKARGAATMTDRWALAGIPLAIFGAYFLLHEHATCPTTGVLLVGAGCIGL